MVLNEKLKKLKANGLNAFDIQDIVASTKGVELPLDLKEKAINLMPDDFTVGSVISHLRTKGILMTEIDVLITIELHKKYLALNGDTPMYNVIKENDKQRSLLKKKGYDTIQNIIELTADEYKVVQFKTEQWRSNIGTVRTLTKRYFEFGESHFDQITSFFYNDAIRVFKTQDVTTYLKKYGGKEFVEHMIDNIIDKPKAHIKGFFAQNDEDRDAEKRIFKWLEGLRNHIGPLLNPLPIDIGSDDARIAREIETRFTDFNDDLLSISIVVTNDRLLYAGLKRYEENNFKIVSMSVESYILLCHQTVSPSKLELKLASVFEFYNFLTKHPPYYRCLPSDIIRPLINQIDGYWAELSICMHFDVPNIERHCPNLMFNRKDSSYNWLKMDCLTNRTWQDQIIAKQPIACLELNKIPLFLSTTKKVKLSTTKLVRGITYFKT